MFCQIVAWNYLNTSPMFTSNESKTATLQEILPTNCAIDMSLRWCQETLNMERNQWGFVVLVFIKFRSVCPINRTS